MKHQKVTLVDFMLVVLVWKNFCVEGRVIIKHASSFYQFIHLHHYRMYTFYQITVVSIYYIIVTRAACAPSFRGHHHQSIYNSGVFLIPTLRSVRELEITVWRNLWVYFVRYSKHSSNMWKKKRWCYWSSKFKKKEEMQHSF